MQAIRLTAWERPAQLVDVPCLNRVQVRCSSASPAPASAIPTCTSCTGAPGRSRTRCPFTLGHEVAGTVAALGPGADGLEPGEPVLVYGPWGCGRCPACSVGAEHLCEQERQGRGAGLGRDGGLAEYVVVPSPRLTVPLDGLDPVAAAPLADAGLTPYHAIRRALRDPGSGDERDRDRHRRPRSRRRPAPQRAQPGARRRRRPSRRGTRAGGAQRGRRRAAGLRLCPSASCGARRAVEALRWSSTASAATTRSRWRPAPSRPAGTSRCSGWPAGRSRCASARCRSRPR